MRSRLGALPSDQTIGGGGVVLANDPWDLLAKLQAGNLQGHDAEWWWQFFHSISPALAAIPEYAEVTEQLMWTIQALRDPNNPFWANRQSMIVPAIREDWLADPGTTVDYTDPQHWRVVVGINNNDVWTWDRVFNQMLRDGFGDIARATADATGQLVSHYAGQVGTSPGAPPAGAPPAGAPPPAGVPSPPVESSGWTPDQWLAWFLQAGYPSGRYVAGGYVFDLDGHGGGRVLGATPAGSSGDAPGNGPGPSTGDDTEIDGHPVPVTPDHTGALLLGALALGIGGVYLAHRNAQKHGARE